jgi:large subunit ribosomal protein L17
MKHRIKKRTLSRTAPHRKALFKTLLSSLLEHGSLVTTEAKARELVSFAEPLLGEGARELTLHRRRRLLSKLSRREDLSTLLDISRAGKARKSGWLRLTKMTRRQGDGARLVKVEIIDLP